MEVSSTEPQVRLEPQQSRWLAVITATSVGTHYPPGAALSAFPVFPALTLTTAYRVNNILPRFVGWKLRQRDQNCTVSGRDRIWTQATWL